MCYSEQILEAVLYEFVIVWPLFLLSGKRYTLDELEFLGIAGEVSVIS